MRDDRPVNATARRAARRDGSGGVVRLCCWGLQFELNRYSRQWKQRHLPKSAQYLMNVATYCQPNMPQICNLQNLRIWNSQRKASDSTSRFLPRFPLCASLAQLAPSRAFRRRSLSLSPDPTFRLHYFPTAPLSLSPVTQLPHYHSPPNLRRRYHRATA